MGKSKHTQGEWTALETKTSPLDSNEWWTAISTKNFAMDFCQLKKMISHEEAQANAKLIAASPKLLDIAIKISKINEMAREHIDPSFFNEIDSVIKEATE